MSTELIKQEIKLYQGLNKTEKEEYIKTAYALQNEVETGIRDYFLQTPDGKLASDIVIEQFRELSLTLPPEFVADDTKLVLSYTAVACSRMVTYRSGKLFIDGIKDKDSAEIIKLIIEKHLENRKEKDKYKDGEFISYIRGFAKYWNRFIDENDPSIADVELDESLQLSLENILDITEN